MSFELAGKSQDEIAVIKDSVKANCICQVCPSFVEGDKSVGYCFTLIGASSVITVKQGCICGDCPVKNEYQLRYGYFCIDGSESEQEAASV